MAQLLRRHGVTPTAQRTRIAAAMFARGMHVSAEDVYAAVNQETTSVSRATVYNTLRLLVEKGLINQVIVDPSKVFYDPNVSPHYHLYDIETGELTDVAADQLEIRGLPDLPPGKELDGVDVVVRLRRRV